MAPNREEPPRFPGSRPGIDQVVNTHTHTGAPQEARDRRLFTRGGWESNGVNWINVQFQAGPEAAAGARAALIPLEQRIAPELMDDVRLLVSELVTNSVRHSDIATSDAVRLDVAVDSSKIRVEVWDSGIGFEPQPRRPGQSKGGGWGLYLVDRLADRWGVFRDRFTRVWFEIDHVGLRPGL
jgi:anti-sigma regulatory factor (Ser/Thr protein kinase)